MEVKINREIREYTESMFFGLSMRQFIFAALALAVSVTSYFLLRPIIGIEAVSWVCMLAAVPFAVLGFVKYNGMTAEKFIWAWLKSEVLLPKELTLGETNVYAALLAEAEEEKKNTKKHKHKSKHNRMSIRRKDKSDKDTKQHT